MPQFQQGPPSGGPPGPYDGPSDPWQDQGDPYGQPPALQPPAAFPGQEIAAQGQGGAGEFRLPQRGSFSISETLPMLQEWRVKMDEARKVWEIARNEANEKKALAKKTRADLIIKLRVLGNESTGNIAIKTSAERNEWADADPDVQATELAADLAQTTQMVAREAYEEVTKIFETVRSLLTVEREDLKRGYGTQQFGT